MRLASISELGIAHPFGAEVLPHALQEKGVRARVCVCAHFSEKHSGFVWCVMIVL